MTEKNKYRNYILIPAIILVLLSFLIIKTGLGNNFWIPLNKVEFRSNKPLLKEQINPVTIESIFSKEKKLEQFPPENLITILATGDLVIARSVNYQTVTRKDFNWPFEKTANLLNIADIAFANFESPLIEECSLTNEGMIFCGDVRNIEGIEKSGIDIVSFANNHLGNYGIDGINSTKSLLNSRGILVTGIDGPVYKIVKGTRFAFLGYNTIGHKEEGISWAEKEKIKKKIGLAKANSDVIVVTFHWGIEYTTEITDHQKELAHFSIDNGADLIIGNHPHWIQPVEIYKNKVIAYAHGNYIFDQMWSEETKQGVLGKYTFYKNNLIDVEFIPIQIENYGQPYILVGNQKDKVLNEMH